MLRRFNRILLVVDRDFSSNCRAFSKFSQQSLERVQKVEEYERPYQIVRPGCISPPMDVPEHISRPDYSKATLLQVRRNKDIVIKSEELIRSMRETCAIARLVLQKAASILEPGITTNDIDVLVHKEIIGYGGYPSTLHYNGFPKSCCTSVNNVVCHGIPDNSVLRSGDIVNIDVTVFYLGCHGDTSDTFEIGGVDEGAGALISNTRECLQKAINVCRPSAKFSEIADAVETSADASGFTVCRRFVGHGIGNSFHEKPDVWHVRSKRADDREMKPGMIFTIEPILMEGTSKVQTLEDRWTTVSEDGLRSAQAEHTVLITHDGCEILT